MLDLIVIANDDVEDLKRTLFSIAYQDESELVNVYLMNDKKTNNFKNIIEFFSRFINIQEIECIGYKTSFEVKQFGIDNTTSEYLMFIKSGDMLEGNIVIKDTLISLYNVHPNIFVSKNKLHVNGHNIENPKDNNDIYGRVFKREFLVNNNIRFVENIITEDATFNKMCSLFCSDIIITKYDFYLRAKNVDFDDSCDFQKIEKYVQNMYYIVSNNGKDVCLEYNTSEITYSMLAYIYSQYLQLKEKEYKELLKYADKFKKIYLKDPLNKKARLKILKDEYKATEELDDRIWDENIIPKDTINNVDIIIPAYNAQGMISKALLSVALQNYKSKIHVYIVDDCSTTSYEEEVNLFKDELDITLLKLEKNSGPGMARQYALDNSYSDFVLFLDSDDLLYEYNVVSRLVEQMKDNDVVQGYVIDEQSDNRYYIYNESKWDLHGKLYRRKLINKYNIRFLDSRKSEDDAFHKLCTVATGKILRVDELIYFYRDNKLSIVNSDDDYWFNSLGEYIKNMIEVFKMSEERNLNVKRLTLFAIEVFLYTYEIYMRYMDREDVSKAFTNIKTLYSYYLKYKDNFTVAKQKKVFDGYMKGKEALIPLEDYIAAVEKM